MLSSVCSFLNCPLNGIPKHTGCAANPGLAADGLDTVGKNRAGAIKHGQAFLLFNELHRSVLGPWGRALQSHGMKLPTGCHLFFVKMF